jgi:hypothetical protein
MSVRRSQYRREGPITEGDRTSRVSTCTIDGLEYLPRASGAVDDLLREVLSVTVRATRIDWVETVMRKVNPVRMR